ncbi:MAG: branched-chain amino acid ABC transporter permease [Acidibrevibacterium sp.]|uniref:branched-chain amino acid ABC transporter permease n=1 Tax=Acidibrevibacterium fodinaquatile TaxID=1969806 RepID=UPI000E0D7C5A|nr:branched-chain amino acid ABC transporter permease [Acidibrevibacterium fodinaquatile]MCA7120364.1 branched-chain amino acid ABC transporter permease [Acidibrevibacterium fodinaquatile]
MLNILVYGAVTSAVYAMLAVGFTLIFGVARVLNLAHGAFYGLGAYAAYVLTARLGWPILPAAIVAVLFVAAFGVAVERVLIRPLRGSALAVLMITIAVGLLFEQAMYLLFGSEARNVPAFSNATWSYAGLDVSGQRLLTLGAGAAIIALLWLFINGTRLGAAILALSQDREGALYVGIPADRIYAVVMAISAAIAAAAGVLTAPFLTVQPTMDLLPMIKAFSIVIVGGLGSIPGSILAALLLGYSETIVAYAFSPAWTEIVSLVAVLLTLILRPAGLLGKRAAF